MIAKQFLNQNLNEGFINTAVLSHLTTQAQRSVEMLEEPQVTSK